MLSKVFSVRKPIIGMVHLKRLVGQKGFRGIDYVVQKALEDASNLRDSGIDALCIENWEDASHGPFISNDMARCIEVVVEGIAQSFVEAPIGLNVLPNDYRAAFAIAKKLRLSFVWLDVFVDRVRTDYAYSQAPAFSVLVDLYDLKEHRKGMENSLLFASIHPKHYKVLEEGKTIEESAEQAVQHGADAIVITKATGSAPDVELLKQVKRFVGNFPILLGSGLTPENVGSLLPIVDGAIVGTSVKDKNFARVIKSKAGHLMNEVREVRRRNSS